MTQQPHDDRATATEIKAVKEDSALVLFSRFNQHQQQRRNGLVTRPRPFGEEGMHRLVGGQHQRSNRQH